MAIDAQDDVYIVDMTGRIQVFQTDGQYLRGWRTPAVDQGKPCGLSFARDGNLLVADTHYFRILTYTPQGELLESRTLGGESGTGPGQFNFVTDVVQDAQGCFYVAEYGLCDRVQKFAQDGRYLFQWGGRGRALGEFARPQSLAVDAADRIWVADACNHRIQIFAATGSEARLVGWWGEEGDAPGQLCYPYGIALDGLGHVYVSEFGNHRVQKFTEDGRSLGCWGTGGRRAGELSSPWAVALDSRRRVFILDTYNHRVQQIRL
ncbi:MAG: hypothetical protein MUF48_14205 [Pirellulaceae bacterium]|jgi:sugar lactone lactonase YvrE|nr:hypothetical protein [Pirellulaceae bacterium]